MRHFHARHRGQPIASSFGKPKRSVSMAEFISRTLNAPTDPRQISFRLMARTALTHGLVNGLG
jgi:hypothetical protein